MVPENCWTTTVSPTYLITAFTTSEFHITKASYSHGDQPRHVRLARKAYNRDRSVDERASCIHVCTFPTPLSQWSHRPSTLRSHHITLPVTILKSPQLKTQMCEVDLARFRASHMPCRLSNPLKPYSRCNNDGCCHTLSATARVYTLYVFLPI